MNIYALVFLSWICIGYGRRVSQSAQPTPSSVDGATIQPQDAKGQGSSSPIKTLASLLASVPSHALRLTPPASPGKRPTTQQSQQRVASSSAQVPPERVASNPAQVSPTLDRRDLLKTAVAVGASLPLAASQPPVASAGVFDAKEKKNEWKQVILPLVKDETPILFDIEFDSKDPNLGWIIGNRGTFLQTKDGGNTWEQKEFANLDEEEVFNYKFTGVSFKDGDGWIIGKPLIILHTRDGGDNWERVPLGPKLPGEPSAITAQGPETCEMATSAGAIYTTTNTGRNWKAKVKETIDATLNRVSSDGVQGASFYSGTINSIQRDKAGSYLAVSSRGNFYLTYQDGDDFWVPHNRDSSRRLVAMGFKRDTLADGLWMSAAGGEISTTDPGVDLTRQEITFRRANVRAAGYGILDVAYLEDGKTAFAVGGSGNIFRSDDGGRNWNKDESADKLPTNLYKVKFFGNKGYALGSGGTLLKFG